MVECLIFQWVLMVSGPLKRAVEPNSYRFGGMKPNAPYRLVFHRDEICQKGAFELFALLGFAFQKPRTHGCGSKPWYPGEHQKSHLKRL